MFEFPFLSCRNISLNAPWSFFWERVRHWEGYGIQCIPVPPCSCQVISLYFVVVCGPKTTNKLSFVAHGYLHVFRVYMSLLLIKLIKGFRHPLSIGSIWLRVPTDLDTAKVSLEKYGYIHFARHDKSSTPRGSYWTEVFCELGQPRGNVYFQS